MSLVTRTFTFGTTVVRFDQIAYRNLSLTGSGTAVAIKTTASWFNNLDFGTTAFDWLTALSIGGNLTLSTGGTFTGLTATDGRHWYYVRDGKTIAAFTINNGAGTTTLAGALRVAHIHKQQVLLILQRSI
jgi:hypothetical protein